MQFESLSCNVIVERPNSDTLFRTLRREPQLTQFETAQIANLCPADAEEAKSIVPRRVTQLHFSTAIFPYQLSFLQSRED